MAFVGQPEIQNEIAGRNVFLRKRESFFQGFEELDCELQKTRKGYLPLSLLVHAGPYFSLIGSLRKV